MKRIRGCMMLVAVGLLLALALPTFGQRDMVEPNLYFQGVWAPSAASVAEAQAAGRATLEPAALDGTSAAYMTIANAGGTGVQLIAAESPAAGIVEIQDSRARPVEGGLDVPAGGVTALEPGGFHIRLMDLTAPLEAGQAVPLTLTFALLNEAGARTRETMTVEVAAPVLDEAPVYSPFAFSLIWARPAEADGVSAAYMHILNAGEGDDTLVSASTEVAGVAEIHEMNMVNDVMEMRPVEGGVPLALGDIAVLEPGGIHVMLMDLQQPLEAGTAFTLTLTFESGEVVTVGVPVYDRTLLR